MSCYECAQGGICREAVGLCHHCSAGLCAEHVITVTESDSQGGWVPRSSRPRKARLLLCRACHAALQQPLFEKTA